MSAPAFIGDRWRDLAAADVLGGKRVLVHSDATPQKDVDTARETQTPVVASLSDAVAWLLDRQSLAQ